MEPRRALIANTSQELLEILTEIAESAGFETASAYTLDVKDGKTDLEKLVCDFDPAVVVWDVALPYAENWLLLQRVRREPYMAGRRIVATTTNSRALAALAGEDAGREALEIVGKPMDLDRFVAALEGASAETGSEAAAP